MQTHRRSMLLSLGLILAACLLAGAAVGGPLEKKCYDSSGNEIPCPNSNFSETQFAARATARKAGPTSAPVVRTPQPVAASVTPSPTASPTATATNTPVPSLTPIPTLSQAQATLAPAAPAAQQTSSGGSMVTLAVLVGVIALGALLIVLLGVLVYRWLSGRGNQPPGPAT